MSLESEKPNLVIRDWINNGGAQGWEFKDLAKDLYNAEEIFRFYFFQPKHQGDYEMPRSVIGFDTLHINTLAHYLLLPDSLGLRFKIEFNTRWLERPQWSLYETLLHEMMHVYVENNPEIPPNAKGHGKVFVSWCEEMGLHPRIGHGSHWKIADGQFERLMDRWGVEKPPEAGRIVDKDTPKDNWWEVGPKPKGASTLHLYVCDDCTKKPQCKFRSGKTDLEVSCKSCDGTFHPVL